MNKAQALNAFWNSFGVRAYDESTVPDDATLPRITYDVVESSFGDEPAMNASIWDRSTSWKTVEELKNAISDEISYGGRTIPYDGGMIWLKKASPFAQRMRDSDDTIRRIVLTVTAEYISEG